MGRPLGSRNRWVKETDVESGIVPHGTLDGQNEMPMTTLEGGSDERKEEEKERMPIIEEKKEIVKSKTMLKNNVNPLGTGEAYFEAPDGTILVGSENADRLWYRAGNGGRGMWINKKR